MSLEKEFFHDIDKSADTDQNLFWSLLNRNKGYKRSNNELVVNNKVYRTSRSKAHAWADYFSTLYTPQQCERFDHQHKKHVEDSLEAMHIDSFSNNKDVLDNDVTMQEVVNAVNSLKCKKSCGFDCVSNEHLIHGGLILYQHLTCLFNLFLKKEHIPANAKRGLIVTIPKSGKKKLNRLESYRGITLLPAVYKLFESVILQRIKQAKHIYNLNLCHSLQNAYQTGLCSLMTSFILKETINYHNERGSKTYCCMLDASSAFDTVWHDGLFYKLYNTGINGRLWRVLRAAYTEVKSCVLVDSCISPLFDVRQSVRQGGVLSAWLYVIYMNQLPEMLESKRVGAFIGGKYYGCPMQADDVALLSLTKTELDDMMDLCYRYSCMWRYTLNPEKSVVLVFGESPSLHKRLSAKRQWKLGNDPVREKNNHRHVGISLSSSMKNTEVISTACQKLRSSFFALVGSGLQPGSTSPLTLFKLFKSICIPRGLFSCELMSNLSKCEINMLEVTYRFCIKYMQNFNKRTKTNICLASLGATNIESIIDIRKLSFLRRLCTTPMCTSIKNLFINRLVCFQNKLSKNNVGFVQDVMRIIEKYDLTFYINQFVTEVTLFLNVFGNISLIEGCQNTFPISGVLV